MGDTEQAARNVAQVQGIYARYARGEREALYEALSPDAIWRSEGDGLLPWAGTHRGRAGVEAYFATLDAEASVIGYEVEQVIAQGEWVAILATATVRYHAGGQECRYAKADFVRLVEGQVVDFREFYDTARACQDHACRASG